MCKFWWLLFSLFEFHNSFICLFYSVLLLAGFCFCMADNWGSFVLRKLLWWAIFSAQNIKSINDLTWRDLHMARQQIRPRRLMKLPPSRTWISTLCFVYKIIGSRISSSMLFSVSYLTCFALCFDFLLLGLIMYTHNLFCSSTLRIPPLVVRRSWRSMMTWSYSF